MLKIIILREIGFVIAVLAMEFAILVVNYRRTEVSEPGSFLYLFGNGSYGYLKI